VQENEFLCLIYRNFSLKKSVFFWRSGKTVFLTFQEKNVLIVAVNAVTNKETN
jgi:TATA-box binding protein (TBP) (component of TFIID and TFIIIB)